MMRRALGHLWVAALVVLLGACCRDACRPPVPMVLPDPWQAAGEPVFVQGVVDAIVPKAPVPNAAPVVNERTAALIVSFEIGDPATYTRKYERPVWPGAASGVTVGIGYDLGQRTHRVIAMDWQAHPHAVRLASAAGISGPLARDTARSLADIVVRYELARAVFDQTSVVEHYRVARRAFGPAFDRLNANAQGALVDLVFNRGGSMTGERRVEMRAIRDECLPRSDTRCAAAQLRKMQRLWRGTDIERGMSRRCEARAVLMESAA